MEFKQSPKIKTPLKSPSLVPANEKPPNCCRQDPLSQTDPKRPPNSLYMVTEEMDLLYLPNKCSSNRLIFPQLRRENRLADLGLDQKGNFFFFKQLHGIIKHTHTQQQHNPTTEYGMLS